MKTLHPSRIRNLLNPDTLLQTTQGGGTTNYAYCHLPAEPPADTSACRGTAPPTPHLYQRRVPEPPPDAYTRPRTYTHGGTPHPSPRNAAYAPVSRSLARSNRSAAPL